LRLAPIAYGRNGGNLISGLETWGGLLAVADNLGMDVRRINLKSDAGYAFDVERMLEAVDSETRMLMIVSPNNPTGATLSYADIKQIADNLPSDVLFVLDQAYIDYYDGGASGLDLVREGYRNVLVTQTFSKAFALAGLRCGYGLAHPDILKEIKKFGTGPASINIAGYGAILGSLDDPGHAIRSRRYVQKVRKFYERQFADLGLDVVSGPPPFILFETGDRSQEIYDELLARKIFITHGRAWNMPGYLRVSYGTEEENEAFFNALTTIV
jgi:histidinol-phosphate aminotransferase